MELDLENQYADRAYTILASLVVPRPIALVTTMSPEGHVNAAPFSFFNLMGATPPIVAIAPGDRSDGTPKDTAVNIGLTHEFVVNLVIGTIKRVHLRDEFFDEEKRRVRSENLFMIGRMAAPDWYCRTRDRFELVRPKK